MGQAQPRVTPTTQQLNQSVSAVAAAGGTATFTFQSPPQGLVWTGTLSCGNAPTTAAFLAAIGATYWGTWGGDSVAGPVQAYANQTLVVTATGLTPGSSYDLVWTGSSDEPAGVQPIFPDVNSSAVAVALASTQGFVDLLTPTSGTSETLTANTPLSVITEDALHSYDSLLVIVSNGSAVTPGAIFQAAAARATGISTIWPSQSQSIVGAGFGPLNEAVFTLPCAYVPGDLVQVLLQSSVGGTAQVYVFGVTAVETMQVIAPVGMPLGTHQVGGTLQAIKATTASGTAVQILPAPPAGFVYRLHRLVTNPAAATSTFLLGSTSNFIYSELLAITAVGLVSVGDDLNGQIVNEALKVEGVGGAVSNFNLSYDLIPVQTIQ